MKNGTTPLLDWDALRRQSAAGGPRFWRGLEELAETDAFRAMLHREFPDQAAEWTNPVTRRRFLLLMGASLALAGLSGCGAQLPPGKILPYVRQPEGLVPGKALYFATAMTLGGLATGLLVESHEGRPTKIEGNPTHPASLGATDAFAQASILTLYDPDRSQSVTYLGRPRGWSELLVDPRLRQVLERQRRQGGAGLRVLTETITSPTLADQLLGDRDGSLRRAFPEARWYQYDPARSNNPLQGARLAFGTPLHTIYRFDEANVVLALDADFLACGPAHLRYVHDFMSRRRVPLTASGQGGRLAPRGGASASRSEATTLTEQAVRGQASMNRLYAVESMPSSTGAKADHRLPVAAGEVGRFARALAAELGVEGIQAPGELVVAGSASDRMRRWIAAVARDLQRNRGTGIVLAGDPQPASVHALVHAINQVLGNAGKTVLYTEPVEARPAEQLAELRELCADMAAGRVELLLILGANPVYSAPADLEFVQAMQRVPLRIHHGLYQDETAAWCHWHVPETHYLEQWSDARAFDGAASLIQPLINPLYISRSAHELLAALLGESESLGYEIVRNYWRAHWPEEAGAFEPGWERALHDGVIPGTAFPPKQVSLQAGWAKRLDADQAPGTGLEIVFRPDPTIYDGRFANNAWLQELPKPISKLTWDNAAFLSPRTAERLGLTVGVGSRGGQHGEALVDIVELQYQGRVVRAPAWITPGHADDSVTVTLGYGRGRAGAVGGSADSPVGFNAYLLRTSEAPWIGTGLEVRRTGERGTLACTQVHHSMEDRAPVRFGTLQLYQEDPRFILRRFGAHEEEFQERLVPRPVRDQVGPHNEAAKPRLPLSLYPEYDYSPPAHRWGMAIDLTACTGCSACVVACQAENNIPVVGKEEVTRGREMHWLRIDRYYAGDPEDPLTFFQPVPCMHCENAPCEVVCPTMATVHSHDGLNDMIYNRCVGTRYCSNNCPYKVRRFNFLEYANWATESLKLGRNPDVTVRSRGVMEKCTYCVQRIRTAEIEAAVQDRPLRDGDVLTACQAACPARAIVFGDMNDPQSLVARLKAQPLDYGLLASLNTRPRTTYRAALRNPNPELEGVRR